MIIIIDRWKVTLFYVFVEPYIINLKNMFAALQGANR